MRGRLERRMVWHGALLLFLMLIGGTALAQGAPPAAPPPSSRTVTEPGYDVLLPDPEPPPEARPGGEAPAAESELDIANRVLSAAKQVTTVQEAPSIVTVITAEEIQSRGYRTLNQALTTIPGWLDVQGGGNLLSLPLVRGTTQAALLLRDGVSMFEPVFNVGQFNRAVPLETIKRIEVVTGPGGVLWGANSFLGIVNTISKDADDINGVEGGLGYGDGSGSPQDFRAWVLFGKSFALGKSGGPRLRVVQHLSFESYVAPVQSALVTLSRSPAPQPPGPAIYLGTDTSNPNRSYILNIDGHIGYGPLTLSYAYPIGEMNSSLSFGNTIATQMSGEPKRNQFTVLDRYLVLQYKDRFLHDQVGLDGKLYGIQFIRDIGALVVPGSTALFPSGLGYYANVHSYRVGGTIDGDATLPLRNRLLWGGEAFHEWVPEADVTFPEATMPGRLPLACPLQGGSYDNPVYVPGCPLPFVYGAQRTVLALYLSDQFRPVPRLTLDAGIRYQVGLGERGYNRALIGGNGQLLGSASVVWNFYADMHLKANYATGFRPPVFNNSDSNGGAVQFSGNKNLQNERSQAFQAEWNGRLLKNIGPIRELQLRADYSYTQLDSLIVISGGSYSNTRATARDTGDDSPPARRAIHSVEAGGRLYLKEHVLSAGYTFLHIDTDDKGMLRSIPQHWFSLGAVIVLVPSLLDANATLNITGSYDDPNRLRTLAVPGGITVSPASDLTFDRLPPQALLNLGLRARFLRNRLWVSGNVYNVLNQRYYYPDVFYDLTPTLEVTPTPAPGWSFFLQVGGKPW